MSFFRHEPAPWGKSSKRKGISSLFHSNLFNVIVMPFDIKLPSCKNNFTPLAINCIKIKKSPWKFHGWEASKCIKICENITVGLIQKVGLIQTQQRFGSENPQKYKSRAPMWA